jgi:hypothetical protein
LPAVKAIDKLARRIGYALSTRTTTSPTLSVAFFSLLMA